MASLWREQWMKIVALCMAVLLWLYVSNEQNPVQDAAFNGIDLVVQNQPDDFVLQGVPATVNIRVKGNRNVIGVLQRRDFTAYLRLPRPITPGSLKLKVQVQPPPGAEVVKITPGYVELHADQIISKNIPVVAKLQGVNTGGITWGEVSLQPSQVQVQGPGLVLAKISTAGVTVNVTGATDTIVQQVSPVVGAKGVTVQPGRVTVTVPVAGVPVQSLPVRVNITGAPAAGFEVGQVAVDPDTVQVQGPQIRPGELTGVETVAVDITGATENIERKLKLVLPAGAGGVKPEQVSVQIQVRPEQAKPDPDTHPGSNDDDEGGAAGESGP